MRARAPVPLTALLAAGLVALVVTAVVVVDAGGGRGEGDGEDGGERPESLAGYSIDYDVTTYLPSGGESGHREVRVLRPFAGADVTFVDGAERPRNGSLSDGSHAFTLLPDAAFDLGEDAPGPPPGDHRLAGILDDLLRLGLLERRAEAEVADRACVVYRTGAPLGDPLRAAAPEEYVDWCIDGDGLVLREQWYLDGSLLRVTAATRVDPVPPAAGSFSPPEGLVVEPHPAGTSTRQSLATDAVPEVGDLPYWVAEEPGGGLVLESRWRVVHSSATTGVPAVQDIAFVDVYRDGSDAVLVRHRERAIAGPAPSGLEVVDLGRLGTAQVGLSLHGVVLTAEAGPWIVSVSGAGPVADLVAFARRLADVSGR